jgi:hypothetical protein
MENSQNNLNRSRFSLQLGDGWKTHARVIPVGFEPIGLITRKGLTQSIALASDGEYYAFGTGKPELMPKHKVQMCIAEIKTGIKRPNQAERMKAKAERKAAHEEREAARLAAKQSQ